MTLKLAITGGGGFCGTHLADHFSSSHRVTLFDNFERDALRFAPHLRNNSSIAVYSGNILQRDLLQEAFNGAHTVIHLAAVAGVSNYYERSLDTLQVNILGTFNAIEAAIAAGVHRMVYFSTSEIYGPAADNVSEAVAPTSGPVSDRRWTYSVSKLAGEHIVFRYAEKYGIKVSVVRPFNIYGPRQVGEGAISNFFRRVAQGEPLEVYGEGTDVRAWCHVNDLVKAVDLILSNDDAVGQSFNIGNPDARLTTAELAEKIISLCGRGQIRKTPMGHSLIRVRAPDISLARSILGFQPVVDLDTGLKDTMRWYLEQRQ
jgi:nucleoside-diphosphate-sugar epimerase